MRRVGLEQRKNVSRQLKEYTDNETIDDEEYL